LHTQPSIQKLFYRIGEVAEIAGVKPHVLRYWESEFGFLSPRKNEGNQRLYTQKDVEKVLTIKKLLYQDKYTVAGAKKAFRQTYDTAAEQTETSERLKIIEEIKTKLEELKDLLKN